MNKGYLKHSKLHQLQKILTRMEKYKKALSCLCDMIKNDHKTHSHTKQGAITYVRWGRTTCPGNGTELMYSDLHIDANRLYVAGYAAGSWYNSGGASNHLCLPKNPDWAKYQASDDKAQAAKIYGTEYQTYSHRVGETLDRSHLDYEVPCAVCQNSFRTGVFMLPGKTACFPDWHLEYRGYLMSGHPSHRTSEYVCVDAHPEHIGSKSNQNGQLLYPVEAACGSLKCPPYVNNREICSVCTPRQTDPAFVAFTAQLSHDISHLGFNEAIIFDKVVTNHGNGYESQSGHITASVAGIYHFTTTIVKNGNEIARAYTSSIDFECSVAVVIIQMAAGDRAITYIRWGRTTCPGNGTELMYSDTDTIRLYVAGYTAGNLFNSGGASNYLCLPKNPDWAKFQDSDEKSAKIYGTEYQTNAHSVREALDKSHGEYDVPCAVCQNSIRTGVYMLPEDNFFISVFE
ncbi:hypothetical protein KUTeg_014972 [Tegillarca granosa]|uniref:C1q domain-containing protein n=1 Tax=Tegillarca granosa TaxID=220873 RepID=A0ABQ9ENS1_TEGGR|nr:hypothetical protein KUTeg_014972 [Tegillarca granosa]